MNMHRLFAVAGALVLLGLPVVAQASDALPCDNTVYAPCTNDVAGAASIVPAAVAAPVPVAIELTPAELRYHEETTANMERTASSAGSAALPAGQLSPAERDYHRDTVAHMDRPSVAETAAPSPIFTTSMEMEYHRDTTRHMNTR